MSEKTTQKHEFKTEIKQLFDLIAGHLYSNPDAFVRELISNASDANDKLRFLSLENDQLLADDPDLKISVEIDEESKLLVIRDNGIGMSEQEVTDHLGTIARSGTKAFMEELKRNQSQDQSQLIGQFGVGFYSAFVVADEVTVRTRRADLSAEQAVMWQSKGQGEYTITPIHRDERGTSITLHIKDEFKDYLNDWKLRTVITKYSDHLAYPVLMNISEKDDNGDVTIKEETINQAKALWTTDKKDITDEQYQAFYKHISHDFEEARDWTHQRVEGKYSFTTLLYLPKRAPMDLYQMDAKRGLKLFVQRVFIMDDAEVFLPGYLRFVRGIVDSNDLPLNVSRELLQQNKVTESIKSNNTKKVLSLLEKMAKDKPEEYADFYESFGAVLKEGPGEDFAQQERIMGLLRFASSTSEGSKPTRSLDGYIKDMAEKQEKIYYIIADTHRTGLNSPVMEAYKKQGIEVLVLSDRVDEWLMARVTEYQGKKLANITQGESDLPEEETKEVSEAEKEQQQALIERIKNELGDRVKDVRQTNRLTDSPCCVVGDKDDISAHLRKMLKDAGQPVPESKPIFEVNVDHALIEQLSKVSDAEFSQRVTLLHMQALMLSGETLEKPDQFIKIMNDLLVKS